MVYFPSEAEAKRDIRRRAGDVEEHGRQMVTAEERTWICFARQQVGDLGKLAEVIAHWKATGTGSIQPTTVEDAVSAFLEWHLPRVKDRTASDISHRLRGFVAAFQGRLMHQIHAGDLEVWLHGFAKAWTARSYYKRIKPLFALAVRHRWLIDDPVDLLKAPDVPHIPQQVYTGIQFGTLITFAKFLAPYGLVPKYLTPALLLQGLAWMRTSELVKLYPSEDVLNWEDVDWDHMRIHIRPTVGKATRRKTGNERFIPITDILVGWQQRPGSAGYAWRFCEGDAIPAQSL